MTYQQFGLVEASDYNTLAASITELFGTGTGDRGYGGNSLNVSLTDLETSKATSESIEADDWRDLRNAIADLAMHQGTTLTDSLPALTLIEVGDIITFFSALESSTNLTDLTNNRLTVGAGNSTITTALTDVRTTAWTSFLRHEFTVTFASTENARFFFNTGGAVLLNASRTGGSASSQNTSWSTLVSTNSPFTFTAANYYNLTSAYVNLQSVNSGGAYSGNQWTISARRVDSPGGNGANGSVISFRSDFLDAYTSIYSDTVDGTFTSTIQERRSNNIFNRPSPVFATTVPLTSGS